MNRRPAVPTYSIQESEEKKATFDVSVTDENGGEETFTVAAVADEGEDLPSLEDIVEELKNSVS